MSATEFFNAEGAEDSQRAQKNSQNSENDLSHAVIGAAVEVQRVLGTGLLESAYGAALAIELAEREIGFEQEVAIPATYRGRSLGTGYRADFLIEKSLIVELKAIDQIAEIHRAQLLSYIRLAGVKVGLLINFHTFPVVKGIHRVVNKL